MHSSHPLLKDLMKFERLDEISLIWRRIWNKVGDRLLEQKSSISTSISISLKIKINPSYIKFEGIETGFEIPESIRML